MNNKETDLRFKNKYLKYKHKYLVLKNQLGGLYDINLNTKKCFNTPRNEYSIYKPSNHQCCTDTQYKKCIQLPYQLKLHSTKKENFKDTFTTDWTYFGEGQPEILDQKTKIKGYKSFIARKQNNLEKRFTYSIADGNISSGSYGQVLQYKTSSNPPEFIAVKYGKGLDDLDADISVIKHLTKNHKCSELLVKSFVYEKQEKLEKIKCIIMERAGGTLLDLINENIDLKTLHVNLSNYEIVDILYAVAIAIKCLQDNNLYYTDIKSENILFRNTNDGIRIILADLGSIKIDNVDTLYSASYFPYEFYTKNPRPYKIQTEYNHVISWGIGILILDLLFIFNNEIPTKFIDKKTLDNNRDEVLTEVKNRGHFIMTEFLMNILFCHYTKRWSLEIIIEKLNILRTQLPPVRHVTKSSRRDSYIGPPPPSPPSSPPPTHNNSTIGHKSRRDSTPPPPPPVHHVTKSSTPPPPPPVHHVTKSSRRDSIPPPPLPNSHDGDIVNKPSNYNMSRYNIIITLYFSTSITKLFSIVYTELLDICNIIYSQTSKSDDIDNYLQSNIDITIIDNNLKTSSDIEKKLKPICTVIQQIDYSLFIDYFTQNYINLNKQLHLTNKYNFNENILLNINKNIDIIILNYIKLQCKPK